MPTMARLFCDSVRASEVGGWPGRGSGGRLPAGEGFEDSSGS
jgi:hypothetical protein